MARKLRRSQSASVNKKYWGTVVERSGADMIRHVGRRKHPG